MIHPETGATFSRSPLVVGWLVGRMKVSLNYGALLLIILNKKRFLGQFRVLNDDGAVQPFLLVACLCCCTFELWQIRIAFRRHLTIFILEFVCCL